MKPKKYIDMKNMRTRTAKHKTQAHTSIENSNINSALRKQKQTDKNHQHRRGSYRTRSDRGSLARGNRGLCR
jgi:hypothetical protein